MIIWVMMLFHPNVQKSIKKSLVDVVQPPFRKRFLSGGWTRAVNLSTWFSGIYDHCHRCLSLSVTLPTFWSLFVENVFFMCPPCTQALCIVCPLSPVSWFWLCSLLPRRKNRQGMHFICCAFWHATPACCVAGNKLDTFMRYLPNCLCSAAL